MEKTEHDHLLTVLLADLRTRGCTVRADGQKLYINPRRLVTSKESELITARKPEIIALLTGTETQPSESSAAPDEERKSPPPVGETCGEAASYPCAEANVRFEDEAGLGNQALPPFQASTPGAEDTGCDADKNCLAAAIVRLSVVSGQLAALAEAIEAIRRKSAGPYCPHHPEAETAKILIDYAAVIKAIAEESASLKEALRLPLDLLDTVSTELADALERAAHNADNRTITKTERRTQPCPTNTDPAQAVYSATPARTTTPRHPI
jgi:hypothetical protein